MQVPIMGNGPESHADGRYAGSATLRNVVPNVDAHQLIELQLRVADAPRDRVAGQALNLLCAQLYKRGYTLQAIAEVLDVSREMVRQRVARVPAMTVAGIEPEVSRVAPKPGREKVERPRLTEEELGRLKELQPLAAMRRGHSAPDSTIGQAADEYSLILLEARDRGVADATMAKQLGLTPGAIRLRLQRITGHLPPSMQPRTRDQAAPARDPFEGLNEQLTRLRDLLDAAEMRPGRGSNHAERLAASRAFDAALTALVAEHRVPLKALASLLSRSRSSLAMRLSAHLGPDAADEVLAGDAARSDATDDGDDEALEVNIADGDDQTFEVTVEPDAAEAWAADNEVKDRDVVVVIGGEETPERKGFLTDFTPEATPVISAAPPAAVVDRHAQHASTMRHHAVLRELREAVRTGGHQTRGWDVGQDAFFLHKQRLINVEVKSVGGAVEQYRLGVGQLAEQMQHHLDHLTAGTPWYVEAGVTEVVGVLVVVSEEPVPPVWRRLATRLGIAIWKADQAQAVFSDPNAAGLPPGVRVATAS
ncbi:sigma factor-like helix-turn-helix DNA-binding protein [Micromonospora sp. SD19]|uniref:sigma factor-like helix-turn-helix DNA-binding protein n=1 Tax=Micromonospora parva TaxID=1464048 RepID=UPI00366E7383